VIKFEHPEYLWLLILWVVALLFFLYYRWWRASRINRMGSAILINRLMPTYAKSAPLVKFIFISLAFISLVVGLANPQIGTRQEKVKRSGIDLIVAVDVSKSMLAEDVVPNRLLKAKNFISRFIDELKNDRLGLIVFAGRAYMQMPQTVDYSAARMYLKSLSPNMVPTQGTAIAQAVELATSSFSKESKGSKALVIISDGEDNEEGVNDAIEKAASAGIKVYTIAVGSEKGGPIPLTNGDFKRDGDGKIVMTKVNTSALREYALKGNGKFYWLDNSSDAVDRVIADLSGLSKKDFEEMVYTDYDDQFQYFLALALFFLLLDYVWTARKSGWRFTI
jgi:Ca-activated chloride channel family protein